MSDAQTVPVSVVMSCYNADAWLAQSIESLRSQTLPTWELIAVDDGSTDGTAATLRAFARGDSRIRVLPKENTGLADSLNVGVRMARGRWIARLDADDVCLPSRLHRQLEYVERHPEVILLGAGCIEIDETGRQLRSHVYPTGHQGLLRRLRTLRGFFPHSSAFYAKDAFAAAGGYNPRILRSEDSRLWLSFAQAGRIAALPDTLVAIRKHSRQISLEEKGWRQLCDGIAAIVCALLVDAGVADPSCASDAEWNRFYLWLCSRPAIHRAFSTRQFWATERDRFYRPQPRWRAIARLIFSLSSSRHGFSIVREKLQGLDLPSRLANEWRRERIE